MRIGPILAIAAVAAGLGFIVFRTSQPAEVEVATVVREDVAATIAVSGFLEPIDGADVASQLGGVRVSRVLVDIGDQIVPGQALVEFDSSDLAARVAQTQARIAQSDAQADLSLTRARNAERSIELAERTLANVDDLRAARTAAATQVEVGEARLRTAQENLARTKAGGRAEAIQAADAQVRRASALNEQRARELKRTTALVEAGALARRELEVAETAAEVAREELSAAQATLVQTREPRAEDLRIAEAGVSEARAALAGARQSLKVADEALRNRLGARQSLVQAQSGRDDALAGAKVAQADRLANAAALSDAEAQLAKSVLRAPYAGVVTARFVEPGQTVSMGTRLLSVADPNRVRVRLDVDESSFSAIRLGERASVSVDAFPDLIVEGSVSEIAPAADFARGTIEVRLALDRLPKEFRPRMTVDANIRVASYRNALVVPRQSLFDKETAPKVMVVRNGQVNATPVKFARGNVTTAVITEGLEAGDVVLTDPRAAREGQTVRTRMRKSDAVRN